MAVNQALRRTSRGEDKGGAEARRWIGDLSFGLGLKLNSGAIRYMNVARMRNNFSTCKRVLGPSRDDELAKLPILDNRGNGSANKPLPSGCSPECSLLTKPSISISPAKEPTMSLLPKLFRGPLVAGGSGTVD